MKEASRMQSVKPIFLWVIFVSLFIGCNGQKKAAVEANNEENISNSPLTLVLQGNYAPTDSEETSVITSRKGLSIFFSKVNRTRKPGIPVPDVDFSKNVVLIYCAGAKGNGTQQQLVVAEETDTELIFGMAKVKEQKKSGTNVNSFSIYTLPTTSKKISFKAVE